MGGLISQALVSVMRKSGMMAGEVSPTHLASRPTRQTLSKHTKPTPTQTFPTRRNSSGTIPDADTPILLRWAAQRLHTVFPPAGVLLVWLEHQLRALWRQASLPSSMVCA